MPLTNSIVFIFDLDGECVETKTIRFSKMETKTLDDEATRLCMNEQVVAENWGY